MNSYRKLEGRKEDYPRLVMHDFEMCDWNKCEIKREKLKIGQALLLVFEAAVIAVAVLGFMDARADGYDSTSYGSYNSQSTYYGNGESQQTYRSHVGNSATTYGSDGSMILRYGNHSYYTPPVSGQPAVPQAEPAYGGGLGKYYR